MTQKYGIERLAEHHTCMVDLLGQAGRLEEVFELVKKMTVQATAGIWDALLGACRLHKNVMLADFSARKLFELEPQKTSSLVLLSNIYAESGRWDEVERVIQSLNQSGTEKESGCSWIEDQCQIWVFPSDDYTWLQTPELYKALQILTTQMMEILHVAIVILYYVRTSLFLKLIQKFATLEFNMCKCYEVSYSMTAHLGNLSQKFDDKVIMFTVNWFWDSIPVSFSPWL